MSTEAADSLTSDCEEEIVPGTPEELILLESSDEVDEPRESSRTADEIKFDIITREFHSFFTRYRLDHLPDLPPLYLYRILCGRQINDNIKTLGRVLDRIQAKYSCLYPSSDDHLYTRDEAMKLLNEGKGWIRVGSIGVVISNFIIKTFVYDALPKELSHFKVDQMAQLLMMALFGNEDKCFVVNSSFSMVSDHACIRVNKFFYLCLPKRTAVIYEYIKQRTLMLGNEFVAKMLLDKFQKYDSVRRKVKRHICKHRHWMKRFYELAFPDQKNAPKFD